MGRLTESHHHVTFDYTYHGVFCPKYRRKVLTNGVDARRKELLNSTARELRAHLVDMEDMPDHVPLLMQCDPQFGIHRVMKQWKGDTSHMLHQEFPSLKRKLPSLWTNSYFVATVGAVQLDVVKRYIEDQKGR